MKHAVLHILLALMLLGSIGNDPQMPISVRDQMPLFLKILGYEKHLAAQQGELVVGVLYQERYRPSVLAKDEVIRASQGHEHGGQPVSIRPLALSEAVDVAALLRASDIDVLYVAPLRAFDVPEIAAAARAEGILTLTGVPDYLDVGLSVSLSLKGGKPVILINLPASQAEGAHFHSQLLKLAQVRR